MKRDKSVDIKKRLRTYTTRGNLSQTRFI